MARYYYYLTNYHHRHRHIKRIRWVVIGIVLLVIGLIAIAALDIFHQRTTHQQPVSQQSTIVQQAPLTILRTEFFQFQAGTDWTQVASDGGPQKYVYRNIKNTLVNDQIEVYVNTVPKNIYAEYVVPVTVNPAKSGLVAGDLSDHCVNKAAVGGNISEAVVNFADVRFNCRVDGTDFTVIAGLKGGDSTLSLTRANGQKATYIIIYKDLKANPTGSQFPDILNTFQAR